MFFSFLFVSLFTATTPLKEEEEKEEEEEEEVEDNEVLTIGGHGTKQQLWSRVRGHGKCPLMLSTKVATETSSSVTTLVRGHAPKWGGSPRPPNREQEYLQLQGVNRSI